MAHIGPNEPAPDIATLILGKQEFSPKQTFIYDDLTGSLVPGSLLPGSKDSKHNMEAAWSAVVKVMEQVYSNDKELLDALKQEIARIKDNTVVSRSTIQDLVRKPQAQAQQPSDATAPSLLTSAKSTQNGSVQSSSQANHDPTKAVLQRKDELEDKYLDTPGCLLAIPGKMVQAEKPMPVYSHSFQKCHFYAVHFRNGMSAYLHTSGALSPTQIVDTFGPLEEMESITIAIRDKAKLNMKANKQGAVQALEKTCKELRSNPNGPRVISVSVPFENYDLFYDPKSRTTYCADTMDKDSDTGKDRVAERVTKRAKRAKSIVGNDGSAYDDTIVIKWLETKDSKTDEPLMENTIAWTQRCQENRDRQEKHVSSFNKVQQLIAKHGESKVEAACTALWNNKHFTMKELEQQLPPVRPAFQPRPKRLAENRPLELPAKLDRAVAILYENRRSQIRYGVPSGSKRKEPYLYVKRSNAGTAKPQTQTKVANGRDECANWLRDRLSDVSKTIPKNHDFSRKTDELNKEINKLASKPGTDILLTDEVYNIATKIRKLREEVNALKVAPQKSSSNQPNT